MILRIIIIFKLIIINLVLSGCVTRINHFDNFIIDSKQAAKLNKLDTWTLQGKISWRDQKNNQAAMCYIKWVKNYNKSYITLNSAMNIKSINLEIEKNKVKIIDGSNMVQKDIENIINNISINIENLNYWLLGAPNPKYKYELIDNGFKQQDWSVNYLQYKAYKGFVLPAQTIAKHNYVVIKMIISNFN